MIETHEIFSDHESQCSTTQRRNSSMLLAKNEANNHSSYAVAFRKSMLNPEEQTRRDSMRSLIHEHVKVRTSFFLTFHAFCLGVVGTLTFNTYLSSTDLFSYLFPGSYCPNVYFQVPYDMACCIINLFNAPISAVLSSKTRIGYFSVGLSLQIALFICLIIVFRDSPFGFGIFLGLIFINTLFAALIQASGYEYSVIMGKNFTIYTVFGMGCGSLIVNSFRALCLLIDPEGIILQAVVFYGFTVAILTYIGLSQILYAEKNDFTLYHKVKLEEQIREELVNTHEEQEMVITQKLMAQTLKVIWFEVFSVFFVFAVTLGIFPTLAISNKLSFLDESWSSLVIVIMFNLGDSIGRIMAKPILKVTSDSLLNILVYSRVLFFPAFVCIKYVGAGPLFDGLRIGLTLLLGGTSGLAVSLLFVRTPNKSKVLPHMKSAASFLNMMFLFLGMLGGGLITIPINQIDWDKF